MLVSSSFILAQWVPTNGPYGGSISSIAVSGDNIIAGTRGGGIYLSSNNGINWNQVNDGLTDWDVNSIAANGNIVFAVTGGGAWAPGGVYRSTNYGRSWALVFFPPINPGVISIAIKGNYIYAGTIDGLYRSTDTGLSWSQVYPAGFYRAYALAVNGNNIFAGTYYGIFRSTDDGTSWLPINNGLPTNPFVSSFAISGNTIFAGDYSKGIYLSNDNGLNWSRVNNGLTDTSVYSLAISGNNIFAGTVSGGIFLSTNNGSHWDMVNTGLSVNQCVNSLTTKGNNILAGMSGAGVYLSTNNGTIWTPANDGITNSSITTFATNAGNIFAGTNLLGVFLSTNNGISWTSVNDGLSSNISVTKLAVNDNKLFAGTSSGIFNSTNNGTNWNLLNSGLQGVNSFTFSGNYIIVGKSQGGAGIYVSSDNGLNWNQTFNYSVYALARSPNTTGGYNIFAASSQGVLLSTDNGLNWNIVLNPLSNYGFYSIVTNGNIIYVGSGGAQLIFRSSDNGQSWLSVTNGLPMLNGIIEFAMYGNNLFALASRTSGMATNVFLSINDGISWISINNDTLPEYWAMNFPTIAISESNLFIAATGSGVFRRPLAEMIATTLFPSIQISASTIVQSGVLGITGNQFTAGGQISLGFASSSGVNIPQVIMNANSNGEISYNFNASTYPPGNYYVVACDITTNKYTINKPFEIISSAPVIDSINVTAPSSGYQAYPGQEFQVSWTDKMSLSSNYQIVGAKRKYKYLIDLSSNGGSTWNRKDSLDGLGTPDEFVNLNKGIKINQPGQNYRIKVIDFYNTSRNDVSAVFTVSNQALNNIKADFVWDYSYNNRLRNPIGCVSDGTSRMYIRLYKIIQSTGKNISKVEFSLNDGTSDLKTNGKLKVASVIDQWSDEANGANLLSASVYSAVNDTFWVWYVAPDDFVRTGFADDQLSGSREVQLTIKATYTDNTFEIVPVNPIKIYRPPLMLVYGLGDDIGLWDNYPLRTRYSYLFPIVTTPQIDNRARYEYNAKGLLKLNNSLVEDSFEDFIGRTRMGKQVACNQLYYVGYSMGGILPRYCETFLNSSYRTHRNYDGGFINKLITIDTPHKGSPWADYLYSLNTSGAYIAKILSLYPGLPFNAFFDLNDRVSPAVHDLRINGGVTFNTSAIKANAIVGDMIDGNEPDINNIDNSIIDQLSYNSSFPKYLFLLDPFIYISKRKFLKKINDRLYSFNNQSDFITNSDFIVSTNSQGSGLDTTASNISYASGYFHSQSTGFPGIVEHTYDKVIRILNSSFGSPLLGYLQQTNSFKTILADKINTAIISKLDTTFITPIEPIPFSSFNVNSSKNISFNINDTMGLSEVGIIFQTNSFQTSEKNFSYNFSVQTDGKYLDTQKVLIYAFYQRSDSVILSTKEIPVIVTTDESIISFNVTRKVFKMRKGDKQTPNFKGVFNTFLSEIGTQGTSISAVVENENIVKFNYNEKIFEAVGYGETSAIVNYKGKSDTVYFIIAGDNATGILDDGHNSTNSGIPDRYELFQSYPNPFNPTTTIKYSIPRISFVNIRIYDILGREVKTLVNEEKLPGIYSIQFNGGNFTSGVYFYRLQAGSFVETKKFILLK